MRTTSVGTKFFAAGRAGCLLMLLAALNACATAAKPEAMTVTAQPAAQPFPAALTHAMCVRNVSGGEETNALWVSKVDDKGFRQALSASLDGAGLNAADNACHYPIDVTLLGLSQPVIGLDMTVTSHVNYKVFDSAGEPALLATIDAPYTAAFTDSLIASQRLQKANEGAIRVSIGDFFGKLRAADIK